MASLIEQELVEITDFKPVKKYENKQDYLAALARLVDQLDDKQFDTLSKEAADWCNAAARAISNKKVIPDFTDEVASSEVDLPISDEELVDEIVPRTEPPPKIGKRRYDRSIPAGRPLPIPNVDPIPPKKDPTFGTKNTRDLDKWGFVVGSKNSAAMAMFEKGARMVDVTASLGGTYYAAIGRIIKRGHQVERFANGLIRLTFKGKSAIQE